MLNNSRFYRLVLESPLLLLVFAIIPGTLVTSRLLHVPLPFRITTRLLLLNAICLSICFFVRFCHYLIHMRRDVRYDTVRRGSSAGIVLNRTTAEVRDDLRKAGYCFTADGRYAEKRDIGYVGMLLCYGGLVLLFFIGIQDNIYQFSGTLLHGVGIPVALDNIKIYYPLIKGPLASPSGLPKMELVQQIYPNKTYPKGATEIALWSKEGKLLRKEIIVATGEPCSYRGFDIYLSKQLIDAAFTIKLKGHNEKPLFASSVKLSPLWKKEGMYNFYGNFETHEGHEGELYYDSVNNQFRIVITKEDKKLLDTEYAFQTYRDKTLGDYYIKFDAVGRWSEIHVVRQRHMMLIWFGGIVAVLGVLARIVFRPQRVWLEQAPEGCRVWAVGSNSKQLLKA